MGSRRSRQRAGLGSRRPKRSDRGRKDRPTSPSWVSGARGRALGVRGACPPPDPSEARPPRGGFPGAPPPRGPSPERPGSAAAGESPRRAGHFRGPERGARARARVCGLHSVRPPPSPLPCRRPASPTGCWRAALLRAPPRRTCRRAAAPGSARVVGLSRELQPQEGLPGHRTRRKAGCTVAAARLGAGGRAAFSLEPRDPGGHWRFFGAGDSGILGAACRGSGKESKARNGTSALGALAVKRPSPPPRPPPPGLSCRRGSGAEG